MLTRGHRILTTGYNGAPRGVAHCTEVGCTVISDHCLRATHAEANAVVQGALYGISVDGAMAYCTHQPCVNCSKLLISAGVTKIVYETAYPDTVASQLLAEAGVALVRTRRSKGCVRRCRTPAPTRHLRRRRLPSRRSSPAGRHRSSCVSPIGLGIVDVHGEERRMHDMPKPRVGGIAVFFGFSFALFTVLGVSLASPRDAVCRRPISSTRCTALVGLLFGSLLISASGCGTT